MNAEKTWSTINEVIQSKENKYVINDTFITLDGTHCRDKREIVDHFNNYFTNISHRLNVNLTQTGNDPTQFIKKMHQVFSVHLHILRK